MSMLTTVSNHLRMDIRSLIFQAAFSLLCIM